ncbi:MAG: hypothetical protein MUD02_01930, partial [Bacteroidales bacterium]|nr:hypothetical protein [Bacteroidales bacterium]
VCSVLYLNSSWKSQAFAGGIILILYWLAMTLIPTPGYGRVMLEPGANLAAWIDTKFLPGAMWQETWDPEGILSTFPAIVTGLTGMLAGTLLVSARNTEYKVMMLSALGLLTLSAGVAWSWVFPTNENLWTSSFVLVTSGLAAMLLASGIFLVDILHLNGWLARFGIIYGSNAITVYVLADILAILFYGTGFGGASLNSHFFNIITSAGIGPKIASMAYGLLFVLINFIPALILYRRKIFIKL